MVDKERNVFGDVFSSKEVPCKNIVFRGDVLDGFLRAVGESDKRAWCEAGAAARLIFFLLEAIENLICKRVVDNSAVAALFAIYVPEF